MYGMIVVILLCLCWGIKVMIRIWNSRSKPIISTKDGIALFSLYGDGAVVTNPSSGIGYVYVGVSKTPPLLFVRPLTSGYIRVPYVGPTGYVGFAYEYDETVSIDYQAYVSSVEDWLNTEMGIRCADAKQYKVFEDGMPPLQISQIITGVSLGSTPTSTVNVSHSLDDPYVAVNQDGFLKIAGYLSDVGGYYYAWYCVGVKKIDDSTIQLGWVRTTLESYTPPPPVPDVVLNPTYSVLFI